MPSRTSEKKSLKNLWAKISEEMKRQGYDYSPSNCENKWKVLDRTFKKFIDNQSQTGRGRKTFLFFEEMHEIYQKKRNLYPPILLTAGQEIVP